MPIIRIILIILLLYTINCTILAQSLIEKKESVVASFSLKINADSTKFDFGSSDDKYSDKFFNYSFYNGNLIDGLCNLIGIPRNCLVINRQPKRINFINYEIYLHNEFDYLSNKKNIINFLENRYSFKLYESNMWSICDSWKFIVRDSTKLPTSRTVFFSTELERSKLPPGQNSTLLVNDTIQMKAGLFNQVLHYAEIVSGYYCDNENIGNVDLKIPLNVFKDITVANKFFGQYGIEIVWATRDSKVAYLTFFDE